MKKWKKPVIVVIAVGLEINAYACAEVWFAVSQCRPTISGAALFVPRDYLCAPLAGWRERGLELCTRS